MKSCWHGLACAFAVAAVVGVARFDAGSQALPQIRVLGAAVDGYKGVYYGVRSGLFQRSGLDVQPSTIGSGAAAIAAVVGGSAEVADVNVMSIIQAHDRGIPLKIIAPAAWYLSEHSINPLLVLKDSPIATGADLNGKTVATFSLGDILSAALHAWIDQHGGDSRTVKFVEAPAASMLGLLEQGTVVAAASVDPAGSAALATGKVRILAKPLDAIGVRFEQAAFVAMEPAMLKSPDAYARFARALHDAQAYTNTHPQETVDLVAAFSGLSPDVIARSVRATSPDFVEPRNLQSVIDVAAKYGLISKSFPASDIISSLVAKP